MDRASLTMNLTRRLAFSVCLHFGNTHRVLASCWLIGGLPCPVPPPLQAAVPQESLRSRIACDAWAHLVILRKPAAHYSCSEVGHPSFVQENGQINSLLLAVLPAEKTHGSSQHSGARRQGAGERLIFLSTRKCFCLMQLDMS